VVRLLLERKANIHSTDMVLTRIRHPHVSLQTVMILITYTFSFSIARLATPHSGRDHQLPAAQSALNLVPVVELLLNKGASKDVVNDITFLNGIVKAFRHMTGI
jgi:hypothetical protein